VTVSKVVHEFHSRGVRCPAWLYLPQGREPFPCVVMASGFAGTRSGLLGAYAERFAEAGMAVYVFDYRGARDSNGEMRQRLSVRRQIVDWHAAIETARHLDAVDADRVALWGSSFSAGHVLTIAARDQAVAAVVSQGPHLIDAVGRAHRPRPIDQLKLTAAGLRDGVGAVFRCRPYYIPVVGPPGTLAVLNASEPEPGYRKVVPTWDNRVPARIALPLPGNRPGAQVQRIQAPVLYCVAEQDPVTSARKVDALAARMPKAEVRHYPVDHFDLEPGEIVDQLVADQLDFLSNALRPGTDTLTEGIIRPARAARPRTV
jgi:dienelactone hydrolase